MNAQLKQARVIANLLDNQFGFLGIRFGLDNIVGLIPGLGDVIGLLFSCYLLYVGWKMEVPQSLLIKMIVNVALDTAIGAVPIIGDIGDIFFKANMKNLQLLEEFERHHHYSDVVEGEVIAVD